MSSVSALTEGALAPHVPWKLMELILYVARHCPFSPLALERLQRVAQEPPGFEVVVRDVEQASNCGHQVAATPTVIFPNGTRIVGTPDIGRLRRVVASLRGQGVSMPNKVWYLEQSRLFKGVPLAEIEHMAHLFHEYDYAPKRLIFGEGDLGDAVYLLKVGHVRLYRLTEDGKEISLAVLGPGDVFGELALFEEMRRSTFAEALDQAHVCAASIDDFTQLMVHRPQLTMMVAREIARRRTEAETRIAGMTYASVKGRLAAVIQHLLEEHGEDLTDGGRRIVLRLSHQELANLVGTSRETCTLELGRLQRAGLITYDQERYLVVPHPERLQPGTLERVLHAIVGTATPAIPQPAASGTH
ncbi:cyclic nucleotide-binding domain-containing protein [bacterium]|nr:MAG: cyclic nucleotide-binding domain-containing protein [bacterium]